MNFNKAMQIALQVSLDTDEFDRTTEQSALVALHEKFRALLEVANPVEDRWVVEYDK